MVRHASAFAVIQGGAVRGPYRPRKRKTGTVRVWVDGKRYLLQVERAGWQSPLAVFRVQDWERWSDKDPSGHPRTLLCVNLSHHARAALIRALGGRP